MAMIPYLEHPSITIFGHTIYAFGLMVALAIFVGLELVKRQAPRYGIDAEDASALAFWTIVCGLVGSHWFSALAYYPEKVMANPLELLKFWGSMSSFGGIMGGLIGAAVILRLKRWPAQQALRFVDMVAWAFPFAWLFGRFGCTLAHDHIGIESSAWIAVNFPDGPRLDLGLIEWLLTIPIAITYYLLRHKDRPAGFYIALFFTLYGPIRILLDSLRVEDARYLGATPAQYVAAAFTLAGIIWLIQLRGKPAETSQTRRPESAKVRGKKRNKRR
ncbi:prolipoprotein diacylglyceryl transferase [Oceanococcus atlanticus]|uniref:Prolipoprotein diacylglyceryl transferase n=1 Tax=Oceanococcus atlanticus TaxID=1317117 RepID=A0A1Y1SB94_9GAMM|nr:prolipoprotein diacylglyceryl transferase family protein [Oceanococcus atlanticus]ORE85910.1 prolipoprotein diacylglyceryl transferase [Oceanococcus atlanticus]